MAVNLTITKIIGHGSCPCTIMNINGVGCSTVLNPEIVTVTICFIIINAGIRFGGIVFAPGLKDIDCINILFCIKQDLICAMKTISRIHQDLIKSISPFKMEYIIAFSSFEQVISKASVDVVSAAFALYRIISSQSKDSFPFFGTGNNVIVVITVAGSKLH